jgi:hypothetical protein
MVEVSPLILNGYLSRSYKIFGPTVNPSPRRHRDCIRQMARKNGVWNPLGILPAVLSFLSRCVCDT